MNRKRAFTFIDVLISSFLLAVVISGLASLWIFCLKRVQGSRELSIASQIGRSELERAKIYGYPKLPRGTYSAGRGSWKGVLDLAGNGGRGSWISSGVNYYDVNGKTTTSASAKVRYSTQLEIVDSDVMPNKDQSDYDLGLTGRRTVTVTVKRRPQDTPVVRMSTEFARGGL